MFVTKASLVLLLNFAMIYPAKINSPGCLVPKRFSCDIKFSREGRWKRKRARRTLQLGSDRQTRDPLGATQGIEILWTLKASAFSSRYLFQKYPRIQTTPFTKGQVKKPRYQVPITVTVIFIFILCWNLGGWLMSHSPFRLRLSGTVLILQWNPH